MLILPDVPALVHQVKFIHSPAKFPALVAGFGAGKTEALVLRAMKIKHEYPENDIAIYEPSYDLIRTVLFPKFEYFLNYYGIRYQLHETHKELYIPNYGKIIFRSMDNPEMIIGYEVGDSIIDELDVLKKEKAEMAWRKIIARNRQKKPYGTNTVGVTTTPEGYRFVYEKWHDPKTSNYHLLNARTADNPFLPADYEQTLRDDYDDKLLEAYLNGKFVNLQQGQVYYSFDRDFLSKKLKPDPSLAFNLCVDFNVDPMCWIIAQHKNKFDIRVLNEVIKRNTNTWEMCHAIKTIIPKGSRVVIYGDASGSARDTRSGYSDYTIIDEEFRGHYELSYRVPAANPPVKDRVNAMNSRLSKSAILIDALCKYLIDDFEQVVWKKDEIDKGDKNRTHACFIGETKILTIKGLKNIKDIKKGEYVLTRKGFKKVLLSIFTGYKYVYEYKFSNGTKITCTDNHKFITETGKKEIKDISKNEILYNIQNYQELYKCKGILNITQKSIIGMGIITLSGVIKDYIGKYILMPMEKFQRGIMYIIKILINIIIELKILFYCHQANMQKFIMHMKKNIIIKNILRIKKEVLERLKKKLNYGTLQKKVWHGTLLMEKMRGLIENQKFLFVSIVKKNMKVFLKAKQVIIIVLINAVQHIELNVGLMISNQFVKDAQKNLKLTNIYLENTVQKIAEKQMVYGLTIEDVHEYFAEGILVSNSDGFGYYIATEFPLVKKSSYTIQNI